ncbi:MAG: hypothetical protein H6701_06800 [Myxococcales bacterium]|nr:hypothetical protein [Myxococcales bacterium]
MRRPPADTAELGAALASVERAALAPALRAIVADGGVSVLDQELFNAMAKLAPRRAAVDALTACALDAAVDVEARAAAWFALVSIDPRAVERVAAKISPDVVATTARRAMRAVVLEVEAEPQTGAVTLRDILRQGEGEARRDLLGWIEGERRWLGMPAGQLYHAALGDPALADVADVFDAAIDDDADPAAVAALEGAAARARTAAERQRWQARAVALRAVAVESPTPRPPARAWLAGCDGQGAFIVHLEVERPGGGHAAAEVCVRTTGLVRDGWFQSVPDLDEMEEIRAELAEMLGPWVSIEAGAAAALVLSFADGADEIPLDARGALALFRRVYRFGDAAPPPVEPRGAVTVSGLVERLRTPPFASWFLDDGDLDVIGGAPPPPLGAPGAIRREWCTFTHRAAVEHDLHRRWLGMARFGAMWLALGGRTEEAGEMAAAALGLERDPAGSPLGHAIAERTIEAFAAQIAMVPPDFGLDDFDDLHDLFDESEDDLGDAILDYDGDRDPDPSVWLAAHERRHIDAVMDWLARSPDRLRSPHLPPSLRVALTAAVETQLAADDPPATRRALRALLDAGNSRRESIFRLAAALGEVVQETMRRGGTLPDFDGVLERIARDPTSAGAAIRAKPVRTRKRALKRAPANPKPGRRA